MHDKPSLTIFVKGYCRPKCQNHPFREVAEHRWGII